MKIHNILNNDGFVVIHRHTASKEFDILKNYKIHKEKCKKYSKLTLDHLKCRLYDCKLMLNDSRLMLNGPMGPRARWEVKVTIWGPMGPIWGPMGPQIWNLPSVAQWCGTQYHTPLCRL